MSLYDTASEIKYFIETDRSNASYFQWLTSKGTNYTCYTNYLNGLNEEKIMNNKIMQFKTILYSLTQPFSMPYFYWTLMVFIIHKFNYKKPAMKIILFHYLIRSVGNILFRLSTLMSRYFTNAEIIKDNKVIGYACNYSAFSVEMHPLKWFLTKQMVTLFWSIGEIIADWYPVIRTKEILNDDESESKYESKSDFKSESKPKSKPKSKSKSKSKPRSKSMFFIYTSCILFNLSKIAFILNYFTVNTKYLYDDRGVFQKDRLNGFNDRYWIIQLIIIYVSVIFELSVYLVLRKKLKTVNEKGFIRKFINVSEYRLCLSLLICIIFLPIVSISILLRFHYSVFNHLVLDFSFENVRKVIANVQYYIIYIDQILLILSKEKTTVDLSHFSFHLSDVNVSNDGYNDKVNNNTFMDSSTLMKNQELSSIKLTPINTKLKINDSLSSIQNTLINSPDKTLLSSSNNTSLNSPTVDQSFFTNITITNQNNNNSNNN